jgi:AAA15 family ATPase/GTPase
MLKSLKIKNFRCFEEFDLPQLGRVNLLVGRNNSGKTSILEALHILNSPRSVKPFLDIVECRGEYSSREKDINKMLFDASHFFFGHKMQYRACFEINGITNLNASIKFSFSVVNNPEPLVEKITRLKNSQTEATKSFGVMHLLKWEDIDRSIFTIHLSPDTSIHYMNPKDLGDINSKLVSLTSLDVNTVIDQFNQIVLTSQEETLYESLRIIEPDIERIAPIATQGYNSSRNGGFVVLINKQRVPIGSMGYGIWRMLEITLAMVNIPGGTLLIDEIDTGLHFSVMIDLWKLICKTAEKLDIQVFATTHNSDCWKSLAEVANSDDITSNDITIHRIERGKKASIVFNEQEMAIAAERDIEVR